MPAHFVFNVSSEIPLEFQIAQPICGFTNYLFRTDTSQKNTNEETGKCFAVFPECEDIIKLTNDLKTRKRINKDFQERLKELCREYNIEQITSPQLYKHIRTFITYVDFDDGTPVLGLDENDELLITEAMLGIMAEIGKYEKTIPLCCVCHLDQGAVHFHTMYYIKPKVRSVKNIFDILKNFNGCKIS